MRLTSITITNALGCRRFAADIAKPVVLIAGSNGAGKTSIIEAVRYALTGEMPRVSLKKDAHALVSDGAKTGQISVAWGDDAAVVSLPDCKLLTGKAGEIHPAMRFVCDMHRFATLPDNERRSFLFQLTGSSASAEEVRKLLAERKADPEKIEAIVPMLRSGFPAASKAAAERATEAKGAWKATTGGETYGAKKAEGWKAEAHAEVAADALPRFREVVKQLDADLEAEQKALGAAEETRKTRAQRQQHTATLREQSGSLKRITDKLAIDRAERDAWQIKVEEARRHKAGPKVMACPDCGASLVLDGDTLAHYHREAGDDSTAEIAAELPKFEQALKLLQNAVTNGERDLATAQAATEQLKIEADLPPAETDEEIHARKVLIADIKDRRAKQQASISTIEDAQREAKAAGEKTAKAAGYHADVVAWTLIADALAPDGIPGELLAKALKPMNDVLAQSAADTGWSPVTIDADMQIRFGGRLYGLLSESEKWRADAMLTAAIANLSGLKLMLLDRLDVLDLPGRGEAIGWLDVLADAGEIDTCIVAATLKQLPSVMPATFQAHWIADGAEVSLKAAA